MRIINYIKNRLQGKINTRNRRKLLNFTPVLVCSNCTGGFIYHWLRLRFMSPFINLYISNEDFLTALENWREFINSNVKEVKADTQYPVGQIVMGGGYRYNSFHALSDI